MSSVGQHPRRPERKGDRHVGEEFAPVNGITLCYETFGDPGDRPLLLIMGLSAPMIWWDEEFCRMLADRGFYVIRYDNRDCGRSTSIRTGVPRRTRYQAYLGMAGNYLGRRGELAYTLGDLADDAAGLLDHLSIESAHVTGVSMGGMIAQKLAIRHPGRVRSLVSMSSTTGNRFVGLPRLRAVSTLTRRPPRDREEYVKFSLWIWGLIGSPGFPPDEERIRRRAENTFDRGINPAGTYRQFSAILATRDRTEALRQVRVPALVIHGSRDPLIHVSGGKATARALPNAELQVIQGMGHDLPVQLWPVFADGIASTAKAG
jgi:pimeloyl-ACP methyl ester carboxylesterase